MSIIGFQVQSSLQLRDKKNQKATDKRPIKTKVSKNTVNWASYIGTIQTQTVFKITHTCLWHVRVLKTKDKGIIKGSQKKNKTDYTQRSKIRNTFKYSLETTENKGNGITFSLCSKKINTNLKFNIQRINRSKIKTLPDNLFCNVCLIHCSKTSMVVGTQ